VAKKKPNQKLKQEIVNLTTALYNNGVVQLEGQKRKRWTKHDLLTIKPLTPAQEDFFHHFFQGDQILACGSAGSGKSYVALYLALNEILNNGQQSKIIIVRSAVAAREQGYLPGTQEEKNAPFENPYRDMLSSLCGKYATYDNMKEAGIIEFMTTSHLRGLTWDNAIIILDEVQNCGIGEISTVITRIGENSKIMILGDYMQNDLTKRSNDVSGFMQMKKIIENIPEFSTIEFTRHDIVRGKLVKAWIIACEDLGVAF